MFFMELWQDDSKIQSYGNWESMLSEHDRQVVLWNWMDNPEIDPHIHINLIYDREQWKARLFNKGSWVKVIHMGKQWNGIPIS